MIEGIVDTLGWALIDAAWQGILVGALYACVRPLVRDAEVRLAIGHIALLALAVLPIVSLLWRMYAPQPLPGAEFAAAASAVVTGTEGAAMPEAGWNIENLLPWLVAVWACGVLVHTVRLVGQWRALRRLCAQSMPADPAWMASLARLRKRLGVRARVRLLHGAQVMTPMLVGVLRPAILLPSSLFLQLPQAQVELILAHELAHLRRWDTWFNLLQTCLDTLLFFHPAVHWMSRKVREDREICCDQLVLARGGEPMLYARTLLAMAEAHHRAQAPAPALGAAGGLLLQRVERIVDVPPAQRQGIQMPALGALLALAGLIWILRPADDVSLLQDLGLPPLAASGVSAMVPSLAGLQFSVADLRAVVQPLAPTLSARVERIDPSALDVATPDVAAQPTSINPRNDTPLLSAPVLEAAPAATLFTQDLGLAAMPDVATPMVDLGARSVWPTPVRSASDSAPVAAPIANPVFAPQADGVGEEAPHAIRRVAPEYPSDARLSATEGYVVLRYRVDLMGRARDITVVDAYPEGIFAKAARTALSQWRFERDAGLSGERYLQRFDFRLDGASAETDGIVAQPCVLRTGSRLCRPSP